MPRRAWMRWLLVAPVLLAGCADSPLVLKGQLQTAQQQQLALSRQNKEIQDRAVALDRDNQEMQATMAQARQRNQVMEDQLAALRDQLSGVTAQLAQAREQKQASEAKAQTLMASMRRQGGVTITPNNSFQQTLPAINIPEVEVRRDGDVIRIELPGRQLFETNSARLRPESVRLIAAVAAELGRTYPDQMIGVEGHTDSDPIYGGQWRSNHELSMARAAAVYDVLVNQARVPSGQLFLVGHGGNHPVVSNATPAGKDRNRRVELVIYPDRARR